MSEDIFDCYYWESATCNHGVQAKNVGEHPIMHKTVPTKNYQIKNVHSAKAKKSNSFIQEIKAKEPDSVPDSARFWELRSQSNSDFITQTSSIFG